VDIDGIRSLIAEALASLPARAAQVEESRERIEQYPEAPEHDLDCLRIRVIPRTPEALDLTIELYDEQGFVAVYVGDYLPIELTAPININADPPRPVLDVIRGVLRETVAGQVDGEVTASPWS
jgi:hypothetical protein